VGIGRSLLVADLVRSLLWGSAAWTTLVVAPAGIEPAEVD
jgi:hypothetical protein